ncbi:helix-turn-helix domain-containing protein [Methylorubrum salsuginis]|uniref:AraC-type DNA-binding protein n=1 Tax=Methylorubrum salsuginis TaxID=414703 RepID=A0A1I3YAX1_9HYPH|nr:AraC family transcriptional regulator [Methylorubrum salsuginis]SFK28421.1 AraC-type DNA-binding protein [Methylorubrum salsuginis]
MGVPFANGCVQGEVSAPPDRVFGRIEAGGVEGLTFIDYAYGAPGHSTHQVGGLLVGTWHGEPWTRLTFSGDAEGEATEEWSGETFVLRGPGYAGRTRWSGRYRARYIAFSPGAVERMTETPLTDIPVPSTACDLTERMTVFHLLAALGRQAEEGSPTDTLLLDSVGLAVLRASGALPAAPARRSATLTRRQAARIRELVAARIGTPLTLGEMARAVDLSEGYFVRAFKGSFGVTPYQYVLRERVALAQSLIRSGTVSLSEAAARSGFPDARRMGRTFRKVTGRSPTAMARLRSA